MSCIDSLHYEPLQPPEVPARHDSTALVDLQNGRRFLRALGGSGMSAYLEYSEFVIELGAAPLLFLFSLFDRRL